jgi:hypothetical protein
LGVFELEVATELEDLMLDEIAGMELLDEILFLLEEYLVLLDDDIAISIWFEK